MNFSNSYFCFIKDLTNLTPDKFSSITLVNTPSCSCNLYQFFRNLSLEKDDINAINGTKDRESKPSQKSTEITKYAPVSINIVRNTNLSTPVLTNILLPSMSMIPLVIRSPVC